MRDLLHDKDGGLRGWVWAALILGFVGVMWLIPGGGASTLTHCSVDWDGRSNPVSCN